MLRTLLKPLLLAGALYLPGLQQHTAIPRSAGEWEMCMATFNPRGYRYIIHRDPQGLMEQAHWRRYLDAYSLESTNYTPNVWRIGFTHKDVLLMLHAHRNPVFRNTLTKSQQSALKEAEGIVRNLTTPDMDDMRKAQVLHDALVTSCTYSLSGAENATDMFRLRKGTCEAFGRTLHLLLGIAGVPSEIVYGTVPPGIRHCWNKAFLDGRWRHIDPAWDAVESSPKRPSRTFFAVPANTLRSTHTWTEE